ncbi:MAG: IPT/TIG domain-containing protein [Planctomycetota bacterium]|nr:IPT/TIG domain-containing protein [Planctomycetota bacterium]
MRFKFPLFLMVGLASLVLPACGGGGGGEDPEIEIVEPAIVSVDPDRGSTDGGTDVLIQGSGFTAEGAGEPLVTFGGIPAQDMIVISDATIRATSPARAAGLVDVEVANDNGTAVLEDGFRYMPGPQISLIRDADTFSFDPEGPMSGGTRLVIQGQQLAPLGAAQPRVFVNGNEAQIESVSGANLITAVTPASNVDGLVDVRVENEFGSDTAQNAFRYLPRLLYAADGRGVSGSLYTLDPFTGELDEIGAIGYAVDAMALSPDGILYATTWQSGANSTTAKLLIISTETGEGQEVADLQVVNTNGQPMRIDDLAFVGDELYGWSNQYARPVKVDTATGDVDVLGNNNDFTFGSGEGIAADADENVVMTPQSANAFLWTLDVDTEERAEDLNLFGASFTGMTNPHTKAMAFMDGTLFAVISDTDGTNEQNSTVYIARISMNTGLVTGFIELDESIDAITGITK